MLFHLRMIPTGCLRNIGLQVEGWHAIHAHEKAARHIACPRRMPAASMFRQMGGLCGIAYRQETQRPLLLGQGQGLLDGVVVECVDGDTSQS